MAKGVGLDAMVFLEAIDMIDDGEEFRWLGKRKRRRIDTYSALHTVSLTLGMAVFDEPGLLQTTGIASSALREVHHRPEGYQEIVVPKYNMDDFSAHFRLDRGTVDILITDLSENGIGQANVCGGNPPVSLEKMTLVTLWYLANQESMRGVADSTVHQTVRRVTHQLARNTAKKYIHWPRKQQMPQLVSEFKGHANFPGVIRAIDATHIPIQASADHQAEYNNRKMTHSVVLQAVCDYSRKFTNCFAGFPGSAHDSRVLSNSQLYKLVEQDQHALFPKDGYHLVGDTAYPLNSWLLTPFKDFGSLSAQQVRYNSKLSQTRVVIECAFGLLKGRFRRLKLISSKIGSIPDIILACCVLHNMCLLNNDSEDVLDIDDMQITSSDTRVCMIESSQGTVKRNYIASIL